MTKRATIEEMARWLSERDDFAILGHIYPDGDAAGSTLGLCHALRALGKRAVVCLPGGVPGLYADLPGAGETLSEARAMYAGADTDAVARRPALYSIIHRCDASKNRRHIN